YTSGGPTHHAQLANDVSIGDLPKLTRLLAAAARTDHLVRRPQLWVTEFSWDSNPPDPQGVPVALQARWVSEALYRFWRNGVRVVAWFSVRDEPLATSFYQSSLWYRGTTMALDRPKPALEAFRFPVVGLPDGDGVLVWGRTPYGAPGRV